MPVLAFTRGKLWYIPSEVALCLEKNLADYLHIVSSQLFFESFRSLYGQYNQREA